MKLHIYLLRSGLYAAAAMMAAACSSGSSDEPAVNPGINPAGKAMSFAISDANLPLGASAASRAQITGDVLTAFTVWASMRSIADNTNPGECTPVFSTGEPASPANFVTVSKAADGTWNYADGNQNLAYWQNGSFYSFAAFAAAYPSGTADADKVTPVFAANGHTDVEGHNHHLSFAGFNGTRGADLIYATASRMVENLDADTGPVSLTFHHLTSRLQIVGRVDPLLVSDGRPDPTVTVTAITLSGMHTQGAWDGSAFDPTASTDYSWSSSTPGTYATNSTPFSVGTTVTDLFNPAANPDGTDILMIPQNIPAESVVTITYRHNEGGDTADHTVTLNLYEATVAIGTAHWLPGRSYRYTVNFGAADYILFDAPTVEQWDYQTGGNIIVQPTN